jgi:hypothetical protein
MAKKAVFAVGLCLLTAGCGGRLDPPVDPVRAGEVLRVALDAWKNGEPYGALDKCDPPIFFREFEWEAGKKLVNYQPGSVTLAGRQGNCKVKLTLQDKEGKTREREIAYQIDTIPRVVIVREMLGP